MTPTTLSSLVKEITEQTGADLALTYERVFDLLSKYSHNSGKPISPRGIPPAAAQFTRKFLLEFCAEPGFPDAERRASMPGHYSTITAETHNITASYQYDGAPEESFEVGTSDTLQTMIADALDFWNKMPGSHTNFEVTDSHADEDTSTVTIRGTVDCDRGDVVETSGVTLRFTATPLPH